MRRGTLQQGVHYFQPFGRRSQMIFKWTAIEELIEGPRREARVHPPAEPTQTALISLPNGRTIDVQKATQAAQRLLD